MTEARMVQSPIEKIARKEMVIAIKAMKSRKAAGPSLSLCRNDICHWRSGDKCDDGTLPTCIGWKRNAG